MDRNCCESQDAAAAKPVTGGCPDGVLHVVVVVPGSQGRSRGDVKTRVGRMVCPICLTRTSPDRPPPPHPASPRPSPRSRTRCCRAGRRPGSSRRWTGSAPSPSCSATRSTAYPVIHLTGTNGKTSTSRMIDTLLRALELRTGRFTSPHVERMTERICLDGEPLTDEQFVRGVQRRGAVHPPGRRQPSRTRCRSSRPSSAMAYAAFADAPVDVAVVEVGMGGAWDATNVADGAVAVVLPIAVDHAAATSATRRSTIAAREGRDHQARRRSRCSPSSRPTSPRCCCDRAAEVGATAGARGHRLRRGHPGAGRRRPAGVAAGRCARATTRCSCRCTAPTRPRTPPSRWPRSRRSSATEPLDDELVRGAFAEVTSPGRLEVIRRSPTIVLDAAHNPHGAEATAAALEDSFTFDPLIGVHRRDGRQGRRGRCWRRSSRTSPTSSAPRTPPTARMPAERARRGRARDVRRGPGHRRAAAWPTPSTRRRRWPRPASVGGVDRAPARCWSPVRSSPSARPAHAAAEPPSEPERDRRAAERSPRRGMCAAVLGLEGVALGLTTPGDDPVAGVDAGTALWVGLGLAVRLPAARRDAARRVGLRAGLG